MKEYSPNHAIDLKNHCREGKSLETYCAHIGVTPAIISHWYNEYYDFKEAVEMAPCLELLFWEESLLTALNNNQKEFATVIKSRIDTLMKVVISPIRNDIYSSLKDDDKKKLIKKSEDLLNDFRLLGI